jgi:hypothetical protein
MTLAVILLVSICCSASVRPAAVNERPAAAQTPDQGSAPQAQSPATTAPNPASPAATPAQTPSTQKTAAVKHRKKKVVPSNCVPAGSASTPATSGSAAPGAATPSSTTSGSDAPGSAQSGASPQDPAHAVAPTPAAPSAPTVCPPSKVIVRQGGTVEPSIQLAGGAGGDQATRQRANQMLGATEQNLKKLAGRQLTTNQQDMVNQIHQFTAQSKAAIAAGDFERGRTLAWKAQLLSEELVNPPK